MNLANTFESVNNKESTIDLVPLTIPKLPFKFDSSDNTEVDISHSSDFVMATNGLLAFILLQILFF